LNNTRIVNGGVILLELDYSVGIKHSYRWHHYTCFKMCLYWRPSGWCSIWWSIPVPSWEIQLQQWMNRHTTTTCGGRHILTAVTLSPRSVN
jgi:hypothetical protein